MKLGKLIACCGGLPLVVLAPSLAQAQTPPPPASLPYNIGNAVREGDQTRQAPLPGAVVAPVLPQLVEPQFTLGDKKTLFVRSLVLDGPALVPEDEVRQILSSYENRNLTLAQIYEAAEKITTLYRSHGYLVAKAYVPQQDASGGVLHFKLVPGQYGSITLQNGSFVRDDFVHGTIDNAVGAASVVRNDELERAMLLVSDLPGAGMPKIAIGPGQQPETSDFIFDVPEGNRIDGYLLGDNYGSPYTGRNRASGGINLNSPLGFGDRLALSGIFSERSELINGRLAYAFPVGHDGLRAEMSFSRTTYVLGRIYTPLAAKGTADAAAATVSYPIFRQQAESLYISGSFAHKILTDKILGTATVNRTSDSGTASVTNNTTGTVIGWPFVTTANFSFTQGYLTFANPAQQTTNAAGPNTAGDYTKLNLTFTATIAFDEKLSLATTLRGQKSLTGNLDSSEQFGLTGYYGIRSYDEGLSGDSGFLLTPALKYALPDIYALKHQVGLFTDIGAAALERAAWTTTQRGYTELNDVGLGYYATFEYSTNRFAILKAEIAHSFAGNGGAQAYDRATKALFQVGFTF